MTYLGLGFILQGREKNGTFSIESYPKVFEFRFTNFKKVLLMKWSEIPREAKAYMLYHTLIAPGLIVWILFPLYLMMTGYSVLQVGAFFKAINIASIPLYISFRQIFQPLGHQEGAYCDRRFGWHRLRFVWPC
ncbi:MAG: Uncharacterized protein XD54_0074 [Thermococcus sibiricus]|uniref:Uncharacterized protein n=1 Tax=Thermococcus sibiricus TaxID=172049 RepID=A0A101ENL7_9EURY|nr:MAG: Uncharacterized protein XD54_0074 [Thermococcus sibiricus]KUK29064.1 MAG: Uncharacterized protein XD61_0388 [Thermococcus sp. 40_45]